VPAGCRDVKIAFAPDRVVRAGYAVSLVAGLALLILLLVRRPPRREDAPWAPPRDDAPRRVPAARAALFAVPVALALGFVFAARYTPVFWLAAFVVAWRGVGARRLSLAGGLVLVVAVPVATLIDHVRNRGGYNPSYAGDRIAVHWAAVVGVSLLILALGRALSTARARPGRDRAAPPSPAAPPRSAP
jgi:hypothetical protein